MVSLSNNRQGNVNITTNNSGNINLTSNNDTDVNANMNGNAQRAKSWAVGEGLIDGVDYSAKYYAGKAKESEEIAERSIQSEDNAHIWAEGTDEEVQTLGGEHSSKGWVDYVMENAPTAEIEQTETGATITVTDIHGTTTADILNGAKGDKGDTGAQGEQGIQGAKGDKGDKGDTGASGAAATISVGTVTTGAAGTNASITNSGTSSAAVFNFTIPRGDKGEQGIQGIQGEQGIQGIQGEKGDKGDTGATGQTGATGNGISNVSKISTVGLVDTYRMLYTNGSYFDYTVTNGENGTGSVADVQVNGVSVLTDNVANIDLTNYLTTDTAQDVSGRKTFLGEKAIYFKQQATSNKLGFTLYNPSNTELAALEYRPNTIGSASLLAINCPQATGGYVGFRYWGTPAVNIVAPKVATAGNYYIPTHITNGSTTVTASNNGTVNISTLLPDISTKQDTLVSGTNIKTLNNQSLLGSGNIDTVFVAEYGVTSYADVLSAYNAGKTIICRNSARLGLLSGYSDAVPAIYFKFSYTSGDYQAEWHIDNNDTWVELVTNLQQLLVSGTNIKTINSTSILGSGNLSLANTDLSNLSSTGQAVIDAKVNNDDYYYKSGDTQNVHLSTGGYVTTSGTSVIFQAVLPKSLKNISSISCTAMTTAFRKSNGGYAPSQAWNAKANATSITISRNSDFVISFDVKYGSYGFTNNTPVGVQVDMSLSFT